MNLQKTDRPEVCSSGVCCVHAQNRLKESLAGQVLSQCASTPPLKEKKEEEGSPVFMLIHLLVFSLHSCQQGH